MSDLESLFTGEDQHLTPELLVHARESVIESALSRFKDIRNTENDFFRLYLRGDDGTRKIEDRPDSADYYIFMLSEQPIDTQTLEGNKLYRLRVPIEFMHTDSIHDLEPENQHLVLEIFEDSTSRFTRDDQQVVEEYPDESWIITPTETKSHYSEDELDPEVPELYPTDRERDIARHPAGLINPEAQLKNEKAFLDEIFSDFYDFHVIPLRQRGNNSTDYSSEHPAA